MNRFEMLRDLLDRDAKNDLDAMSEIMEAFPECVTWKQVARELRRLIGERDKLMLKIEQFEPNLDQIARELAFAAESGRGATDVMGKVRKLKTNHLKKLGEKLGFELEGNVSSMRSAIHRWVESGGQERPTSAAERMAATETQINDILMSGINSNNSQQLIALVKEAHNSLNASQFKKFAEQLNLPTGKSKKQTLDAITSFIDNQSVLAVQTGL